jgi:hypothetical protein
VLSVRQHLLLTSEEKASLWWPVASKKRNRHTLSATRTPDSKQGRSFGHGCSGRSAGRALVGP